MNRERIPLAASLVVLGAGAAFTGFSMEDGLALALAGLAVIAIGFLTLFSHGDPRAVRSFELAPPPGPRIPAGVDARVAWSGEGPPPDEVRDALDKVGVKLERAIETEETTTTTRVFTARMGPNGLETNEDDLLERGVDGTAVVKTARNLGMELGDHTLVELVLRVRMEGKDPYIVKNLSMAPNDQLITVGRNLTVPVRVDPDDRTRLLVDWHSG